MTDNRISRLHALVGDLGWSYADCAEYVEDVVVLLLRRAKDETAPMATRMDSAKMIFQITGYIKI